MTDTRLILGRRNRSAALYNRRMMMNDTRDLNRSLLATLEDLISGKITPQQAQAVARVANTVVSVARLEIDHARFVSDNRKRESVKLV